MTYPLIRLKGLPSELERDLLPMTPRNLQIVSSGIKSSSRWLPVWEFTTQRPTPFAGSASMKLWQRWQGPQERRRQVQNEDLRAELEYYNEEYDEEREMEPRPVRARATTLVLRTRSPRVRRHRGRVVEFEDAPNRDGSRVEKESDGRRPSKRRVKMVEVVEETFLHYSQPTWKKSERATFTVDFDLRILGLHEEQRISGFVHGLKRKSLVEFLSTDLPTTYKGLMEKNYNWIEAKEVATNGAPNDHKEGFDRFNKGVSWDNSKGKKKNRDRFSLYKGSNHGLLTNLSKSPREILATEKVAKTFKQPPRMVKNRRSCDMSKYCHFHEDHGHETNQCRELRHQIEEAVKSGQLTHLVKGIKKGKAKASDTQLGEWKKGDTDIIPVKALILMISRESQASKRKYAEGPVNVIGAHLPPVAGFDNSSGPPSIRSLRVDSKIPIVGFSREHSWPLREIPLEVTVRESPHIRTETLNFVIVLISTVFSTYDPNKVEEGKKKVNKTIPKVMKDVPNCVHAEERIVINYKYPEQIVVIRKQLPASFKRKLQDLLRSNADVFD
ncbi:hypothetical protein Tco_0324476 [Tanacetum coccineum]